MQLILRVISYKGLPLADDMLTEFAEQGGSIGRKPGNTMVLADDEHIVSGRHAEICFLNGGYIIKDISTNGTQLVNRGMELKSNSAPLQSGDILRLGEYEIAVEVVGGQIATFAASPFDTAFGSSPAYSEPFAPELLAQAPIASSRELQDFQPLFSGLDSFAQQQPPFPVNAPYKETTPSSPFQDSFVVPDVQPTEPAKDISDFLKGLDALSPIDSSPTAAISTTAKAAETLSAVSPVDPFADLPDFADSSSSATNQFGQWLESPPAPVEAATPAPVPVPPAQTYATAAATLQRDPELMRMFLLGAGISDQSILDEERWPEAMQSIGGLFRGLIEGLMDVLRARAEMKSEFRVSVTTLRSYDNNPLKFNPDVESVLKLLIAPKNPAFTDADTAVKEAFKDIKFHQMAMTAGIQASLTDILARFNPDSFEKRLGEGLVFQKKARCWELYCEHYPELKNLALDDFFGDQFAEAYEKQMLLLSKRQT